MEKKPEPVKKEKKEEKKKEKVVEKKTEKKGKESKVEKGELFNLSKLFRYVSTRISEDTIIFSLFFKITAIVSWSRV